ncbi:MAG TPA: N,N-dimethylformamidase beta subunit family domain-containing protein [Bryobacteraceae bacterium]|nr:N,N-dimethylformamidase beta subunit family domain-containing protein [Bryobacteraceae bacterium]
MLIGFVSDERYVAISGAYVELRSRSLDEPVVIRSSPRGEIYANVPSGEYEVTLVQKGFGSKITRITAERERPHQFRLLSDRLLGYMWPLWTAAGDNSEIRVHSTEQYRLSLWRYGLRKEFERLIGWFDEHGPRANAQITPDGDYTQTGTRWNTWERELPLDPPTLQAPERSGLYYLHTKTVTGAFYSFPWIVAPRKPQARTAILASALTWNAYNNFGGRSNYINADGLPPTPIVNGRQELRRYLKTQPFAVWLPRDDEYPPLSFDRPDPSGHIPEHTQPCDPIEGRTECVHAPAEWRLLAWMEREDFPYDLYADAQLHFDQIPLEQYRVLILGVHPEYWTRKMYLRVKKWVYEQGGKLMYLGGNGLNCEVELSNDLRMRCLTHLYSRSGEMGGDIDQPESQFESRMHRTLESEANLLGVVCSETGIMTGAPFRVLDASHWLFAGTELRNGDLVGEESQHERIPGGASGHETDKRSASSPAGTLLLAKGTNPGEGGAEIVYYTTDSGGEVFSVGSISYIASLMVDAHISRITANVLSRFLGKT